MRWFTIFALYQVVCGRFAWLDTKMSSKQDALDNIYANLLHDINLDISFKAPPKSIFNMNMNMNMDNNDYFIDESPSSMFAFPSFPSYSSFFDNNNNNNNDKATDITSKPLYLMIESLNNVSPPKPVKNNQFSSSIFILEESNNVNGNTWRYTVKTNGDHKEIMTESWSTPNAPKKMYLCNTKLCGKHNGMEMMNILDNLGDDKGINYMHLVPTKDESMMNEEEEEKEENMDEDNTSNSWMNYAVHKVKGCHDKMKKMKNWYYGNKDIDVIKDNSNGMDIVLISDDKELMDENTNSVSTEYEKDDLLLIGMSVIMILITICGVLYVGWRYMIDRKEKHRMDVYVAMEEEENDKF